MITSAFLYGFLDFLRFILSPILTADAITLDTGIGSALAAIGGYIAVLDVVVPVATLVGVFVGVHVVVEGYIFAYKLVRWVYQKIPGIN